MIYWLTGIQSDQYTERTEQDIKILHKYVTGDSCFSYNSGFSCY